MSTSFLQSLIAGSPRRVFPKGLLLIQEGDQSDHLYVLLKGKVRSFSTEVDGRELVFAEYGPIELFGEMSLDGGPRSASVLTLETSECAIVSRAHLLSVLSKDPSFAIELVAGVIRRARMATTAARNLGLLDVYGRLKAFLEGEPFEASGLGRQMLHTYTHAQIAKRIGASREMVSKLMKDLESGGYIMTDARTWRIRDLPQRW